MRKTTSAKTAFAVCRLEAKLIGCSMADLPLWLWMKKKEETKPKK